MPEPHPSSLWASLRVGLTGGDIVGLIVGALPIAGVLFLFVMTLVGLALCMGMANMMSVNNSSWGQLLLDVFPTWLDLFGLDAIGFFSGLACVASLVLFGVCLVIGVASSLVMDRVRPS